MKTLYLITDKHHSTSLLATLNGYLVKLTLNNGGELSFNFKELKRAKDLFDELLKGIYEEENSTF